MSAYEIPDELAQDVLRIRGRVHAYEDFNAATTALLVVDMQNYFVHPDEQAYCAAAAGIVPNINRLAGALRDAGGMVVWIQTQARPEIRQTWANFLELYREETKARRFSSLVPGAKAFDIWSKLEVDDTDSIAIKTHYSAFIQGSSDIEDQLRARNIETVLVTGTVTNVCCDSTARDAMMRGFRTIMVSDGNAAFNQRDHEVALGTFLRVFGDVQSTDQVLENLAAGEPRQSLAGE